MKQLRYNVLIVVANIVSIWTGCAPTSVPDSTTRFITLTSTVWRLTEAIATIDGKPVVLTPQFPYQQLTFSAHGDYNADNGKKTGVFTLGATQSTIIFDEHHNHSSIARIVELQPTMLRLSQSMPVNGKQTTVELVFQQNDQ